jgi:hypothetical protein
MVPPLSSDHVFEMALKVERNGTAFAPVKTLFVLYTADSMPCAAAVSICE